MVKTANLRVGSLFSGAGLCDFGFHQAGFSHQFFCEIDPVCRSILARHWPGIPIYNDIKDVRDSEAPAVDVLVGGFPCQDISCAGKRAGITKNTRSGLWHEYSRIIKEIRPRYAVIENVKGLLSGGMEIILSDLSTCGYDAEWTCLFAATLGAPHYRERVFVVAYPHSQRPDREFRLLHPLIGNMGDYIQLGRLSDWSGIRIDRASREAILRAYNSSCLHRVDDGRSPRLDRGTRVAARWLMGDTVTPATRRAWRARLKALGNGITPRQAYAVALCILHAEENRQ
jgi:DNA (cytosine-5)-methyltransferase 1